VCIFAYVPKQGLKNNVSGILHFCFVAYYFVISIIALDETMNGGSISFKLLNQLGVFEKPKIYK
jgi:hypothetical protein